MSKISYFLRKTGKSVELSVTVRHSHAGSEFTKATGVKTLAKYFNTQTGKVSGTPLAPEYNATISAIAHDLAAAARNILQCDEEPDKDRMEREYNAIITGREQTKQNLPKLFTHFTNELERLKYELLELEKAVSNKKIEIIDYEKIMGIELNTISNQIKRHVKDNQNILTLKTLSGYGTLLNEIDKYNDNYMFADLNSDFMKGFQNHLIERKYKNSTIIEIFKRFKAVINANKKDLNDSNDYTNFKAVSNKIKPVIIFLSKEELTQLEEYHATSDTQAVVKDLFLFMCYTGLRYSDLNNFSKNNIKNGKLILLSKKTKTELTVPLHQKAIDILERYDYSLPKNNLTRINANMKQICKSFETMSELKDRYSQNGTDVHINTAPRWKLVSAHVARKTFINLSLAAKVNPAIIRAAVGHSDLEMMWKHYASADNNAAVEINGVFN